MEDQWILSCQQGHLGAFESLYNSYVKQVYRFIYFKTHQKEMAEDLTSITFMKALQKINTLDTSKASFKTWLYHIARNTVIDHYRSYQKNNDLEDAWELGDEENIRESVDFKMKMESVKKYLEQLKPEQRDIVLLRVWSGCSFQEIAHIMGKTEAACKMNFKRVIEKLRDDFTPFILLLLLFE